MEVWAMYIILNKLSHLKAAVEYGMPWYSATTQGLSDAGIVGSSPARDQLLVSLGKILYHTMLIIGLEAFALPSD